MPVLGGNLNANVTLERSPGAWIDLALGRVYKELDPPPFGNAGAFGLFQGE